MLSGLKVVVQLTGTEFLLFLARFSKSYKLLLALGHLLGHVRKSESSVAEGFVSVGAGNG